MSSIKGIIFDYGGTIDTNGIHWGELIWQEYVKAGVNVTKECFRSAYVHGERELAKHPIIEPTDTFHTLLRKKINIQFLYLKENSHLACTGKELEVAEGCYRRVLDTIAVTRPIIENFSRKYPMVLVTNFYGNMAVVLKEFGLNGMFKEVIESSVVGLRKPDPALFALGVEALGLKEEEIAVVGDSYRKDIHPALQLGCKAVWLKRLCWNEEDIIEGFEPTATTNNFEELPHIIEQFK